MSVLDDLQPSETSPPPHPSPTAPRMGLPAGSCDSHVHVFAPPYVPDRSFTPRYTPYQQLDALYDFLGIDRAVLVQASCNGFDHGYLIESMRNSSREMRGVAYVHAGMPRSEIAMLHDAGFRAFKLIPAAGVIPSPEDVEALFELTREFGWHAQLLINDRGLAAFSDLVAGMSGDVVIDHMAYLTPGDEDSFGVLGRMLETGRVWVKLSGADRVSKMGEPFTDAANLARRLAALAPDQVIWGTDYPHVNMEGPAPDDGVLFNLIAEITPTADALHRMMVANPERLYGFASSQTDATSATI